MSEMRKFFMAAALAASFVTATATVPAYATDAAHGYTTAETELGTLLDDPAARAILDKHLPGVSSDPRIDMGRQMTLRAMQQYAPDMFSDEKLSQIDTELAQLPAKQ